MAIERAPVYPAMPEEPLTNAQVESLIAWQSIDEHRQLVEEIFGLNTDAPYRLTESDLTARRNQLASAKEIGHRRSRSTREIGALVLATVGQMEAEFRKKTLLEIGSGYGHFGEAMARNAKAKVTFLDRDPESLRQISPRAGQIVKADGTDIPFEDDSFERTVSSFSSVHWAEDPLESVKALNEAIRVTQIGGTALVIPLFNTISQRRLLLPAILAERTEDGQFHDKDRYAVTWALQDYAVIKSLFGLAEKGFIAITWANHLAETGVRNVSQELYSAVIDKTASIPGETYQANEEIARQLMPAT